MQQPRVDRKSTRLNSSHSSPSRMPTPEIYTVMNTLSLHDALPIYEETPLFQARERLTQAKFQVTVRADATTKGRSEEHTSELQSLITISYADPRDLHGDEHSFPTRRSSDLRRNSSVSGKGTTDSGEIPSDCPS